MRGYSEFLIGSTLSVILVFIAGFLVGCAV